MTYIIQRSSATSDLPRITLEFIITHDASFINLVSDEKHDHRPLLVGKRKKQKNDAFIGVDDFFDFISF